MAMIKACDNCGNFEDVHVVYVNVKDENKSSFVADLCNVCLTKMLVENNFHSFTARSKKEEKK